MVAPPKKLNYDAAIATDAAKRWKSRTEQRKKKITAADKGQYTKAEPKDRLANHCNRLLGELTKSTSTVGGSTARESLALEIPELGDLARHGAVTSADINDHFVERVIGQTRDFLAVQFFDRGTIASRAVCRIVTEMTGGQAFGTGFLVTPNLLITNHHVFRDAQTASQSRAEFNYQLNANSTVPIESFALSPQTFFLTDEGLDFSLVAVAPRSASGTTLASFGFCPLIGAEGKIITGQPVNIVQHPNGDLKQVVIRENKLLDLPENGSNVDQYAYYEADTDPGSSGSPVFNDQWEVIALHHSGVAKTNAAGQPLDANGKVVPAAGDTSLIEWIANEGIRTSRLVSFISSATLDRGHDLLGEFVTISRGERPSPPPPAPEEKKVSPILPPPDENNVPPIAPLPPANPPLPAKPQAPAAATYSITVPLTITIGLGGGQGVARVPVSGGGVNAPSAVAPDDLLESAKPDPLSVNRPGFDAKFLGFDAPLPTLAPAVKNSRGAGTFRRYRAQIFQLQRHHEFRAQARLRVRGQSRRRREILRQARGQGSLVLRRTHFAGSAGGT